MAEKKTDPKIAKKMRLVNELLQSIAIDVEEGLEENPDALETDELELVSQVLKLYKQYPAEDLEERPKYEDDPMGSGSQPKVWP